MVARAAKWLVVSIVILALVGAAAVLASWWLDGGLAVGGPPPSAGLRLSGAEPETLDPALAQDASSTAYLAHIHAGLVRLDNDLKVVPDLAAEWQTSPDG